MPLTGIDNPGAFQYDYLGNIPAGPARRRRRHLSFPWRIQMNIQIFGTKKSADTRKAERFFKERGIRFQSVDLKEKGLSKGEFQSVMQAVGGLEAMIDPDCKDKDLLALIKYIAAEDKPQKVFENQTVLKQPVVRNGRQATVGYQPDVWKGWE